MTTHALLSPSSASRWMACTPSARAEEKHPNTTSTAAEEGTLAHELAEACALFACNQITHNAYKIRRDKVAQNAMYDTDMQEHCEDYGRFVGEAFEAAKKLDKNAILLVEQRLDMSEFAPGSFGTSDIVIVAEGFVRVIDFKYGRFEVSAVNNAQMKMYALGAYAEHDLDYNIEQVEVTIYQPRVYTVTSSEVLSIGVLLSWGEELTIAAEKAFKGEGEYKVGTHCHFCRNAACKAKGEEMLKLAKAEFVSPDSLTDAQVAEVVSRAGELKKWLDTVVQYATDKAKSGEDIAGLKLVQGRGKRVITDGDKLVEVLTGAGFDAALLYERKLLGLTALERAVGKARFGELTTEVITKTQGAVVIVPDADKRKAWEAPTAAKDDFDL